MVSQKTKIYEFVNLVKVTLLTKWEICNIHNHHQLVSFPHYRFRIFINLTLFIKSDQLYNSRVNDFYIIDKCLDTHKNHQYNILSEAQFSILWCWHEPWVWVIVLRFCLYDLYGRSVLLFIILKGLWFKMLVCSWYYHIFVCHYYLNSGTNFIHGVVDFYEKCV